MTDKKIDIKSLDPDALLSFLGGMGKEKFRAGQIMRWVYKRGVCDFSEMTDLAKEFRAELEKRAFISDWDPEYIQTSRDGTEKYLFRLEDGESVETVRIPMNNDRSTVCVSTQVGCAMKCEFCLTGQFGLTRNLGIAEIVNQVCAAMKRGPVNNIVFMGMGEPLHNLSNVIPALKILYAETGLDFSPRKVTVSTSGLVPEMLEFGASVRVNLAVSLNATTDEVRDRLMPINKRYPLKVLMAACRDYPMPTGQWITFEYILIRGVNDSLEDAKRLVKLLHGVRSKVNIILYNEHEGSDLKSPYIKNVEVFQRYLLDKNIVAVRRASKGQDISAACGQLKGNLEKKTA
jgi:23S rRNA (adenine2503-C2)-methyltransferase